MNDDATALREDASMHRHEHDWEAAQSQPVRRSDHEDAATELAARAAAAGRTDALGHASVLRLQRAAGNAGVAQLLDGDAEPESPVKEFVGHGGGAPLEPAVRGRMESSFGTDFSAVRVHSGGGAAASARAVDAHAYTVGNEIVLGEGQTPGSPSHERTLAHELTHVVQQRSGPVDGTPAPGGIAISSPTDRFERAAETTADRVIATGRAGDVGGSSAPAVQREDDPGDDDVQELAIQRRQEPEEEPEEGAENVNRPEEGTGQAPRPEEGPTDIPRPEEGTGQAPRPEKEEEEEVQQLAVQREEDPEIEDEEHLMLLAIQREDDPGGTRLLP